MRDALTVRTTEPRPKPQTLKKVPARGQNHKPSKKYLPVMDLSVKSFITTHSLTAALDQLRVVASSDYFILLQTFNKLPTDSKLLYSKPQRSVFLVRPGAEVNVTVQCVFPPGMTIKFIHSFIAICRAHYVENDELDALEAVAR